MKHTIWFLLAWALTGAFVWQGVIVGAPTVRNIAVFVLPAWALTMMAFAGLMFLGVSMMNRDKLAEVQADLLKAHRPWRTNVDRLLDALVVFALASQRWYWTAALWMGHALLTGVAFWHARTYKATEAP